jgi:predicted deacylase
MTAGRQPAARKSYSFLKILTGSDLSRRRLPLMSIKGHREGPVVWLTACVHGDEVGGIVIIQELFRKLSNQLLRGSVYAFPLMNPIGFETASRQITLSKEDLNRSFPGDTNGSLAQRIAERVLSAITATHPVLVLDLHNDWIRSIPYALIDRRSGSERMDADDKTREFARLTGLATVVEAEDVPNTLSTSLLDQGIPALTLEMGQSYVVDEKSIDYGVSSVWNLLAHLRMVDPPATPFGYPLPDAVRGKLLRYFDRPLSSTSGVVRFLARPGELVTQGRKLAKVYNAFGKLQQTIVAVKDGLVLGHSDYSVTFPGAPVMVFGVP